MFYWFQNRKSRAKHKLRVLQNNFKLSKKDKIVSPSNDDDSCFGLVNREAGLFPVQNNDLVITEPAGFLFPVHNDSSMTHSHTGFGFGDFVVPVVSEDFAVNKGVNLETPEINFDGGGENGYSSISVPVTTVPLTFKQSLGIINQPIYIHIYVYIFIY